MKAKHFLARLEQLKVDVEAKEESQKWLEFAAWLGELPTPAYDNFMLSLGQFAQSIGYSLEEPAAESQEIRSLRSELLLYYILSSWKAAQLQALMVTDEPKA